MRQTLLAFATALMLSACASNPLEPNTPCCSYGTTISDRLFFGRDIQGTDSVTEAAWAQFVTEVVAPSFPNQGWTVFRAEGYWYDPATGLIRENTFVFERLHVLDARADSLMNSIARSYIVRFRQAAVLRVKTPASTGLIESR
jgi:hypothetical protein